MKHEEVHVTPAQWDARRKATVRAIYGGLVGAGVVVAALVFGSHILEDGDLTIVEAGFVGGLLVIGLIAAMPATFMPAIAWAVDAAKGWKKGGDS